MQIPLAMVGNIQVGKFIILLMEEILHHLLFMKPCEKRDIQHNQWCRISSINSISNRFILNIILGWFIPCHPYEKS